jgi:hypothetical protein
VADQVFMPIDRNIFLHNNFEKQATHEPQMMSGKAFTAVLTLLSTIVNGQVQEATSNNVCVLCPDSA